MAARALRMRLGFPTISATSNGLGRVQLSTTSRILNRLQGAGMMLAGVVWTMVLLQSIPDYSGLQVVGAVLVVLAAASVVVVFGPLAIVATFSWVVTKRPPVSRFTRLSIVVTYLGVFVGALIIAFSNVVSPDSGARYWWGVTLVLGLGVACVRPSWNWLGEEAAKTVALRTDSESP